MWEQSWGNKTTVKLCYRKGHLVYAVVGGIKKLALVLHTFFLSSCLTKLLVDMVLTKVTEYISWLLTLWGPIDIIALIGKLQVPLVVYALEPQTNHLVPPSDNTYYKYIFWGILGNLPNIIFKVTTWSVSTALVWHCVMFLCQNNQQYSDIDLRWS